MKDVHPGSLTILLAALLTPLQAASPPRPFGKLIDVGGRRLHIACMGTASPAVILISGAGEFSFDWSLAMPLIAKTHRVCAWDRAGYAWSDMSPGFERLSAVTEDMRTLLSKAGVNPPWILAGHAMGTIYARDYQRRFPKDVVGLVLVDPMPEEDVQVVMFGNTVSLIDMADHDLVSWPLRPYGPSRTSPPPRKPAPGERVASPFDRLAPPWQAARGWALGRLFTELEGLSDAQALDVMESERAGFSDLYNARHAPPGDLPVVVLSRGKDTTPAIASMQEEQGRISSHSVHKLVQSAGTQIHIERPELVADALNDLTKR
jgi:pimeloyl-ACP methyl ester carboxylesterase